MAWGDEDGVQGGESSTHVKRTPGVAWAAGMGSQDAAQMGTWSVWGTQMNYCAKAAQLRAPIADSSGSRVTRSSPTLLLHGSARPPAPQPPGQLQQWV